MGKTMTITITLTPPASAFLQITPLILAVAVFPAAGPQFSFARTMFIQKIVGSYLIVTTSITMMIKKIVRMRKTVYI